MFILDIETNEQRTKLDVFEDDLFLVMKMIYPDKITQEPCFEQISFYVKENILITVQEKPKDIFDKIKSKLTRFKTFAL